MLEFKNERRMNVYVLGKVRLEGHVYWTAVGGGCFLLVLQGCTGERTVVLLWAEAQDRGERAGEIRLSRKVAASRRA